MKFLVLVSNTGTSLRIIPETKEEKGLLGHAVGKSTSATLEVSWDGHESYRRAEYVEVGFV